MKTIHITKNVKLLSIGFLLIFFGFDGIQQYVTTYFDGVGVKHVGFTSLIIIYAVFTLVNPIGAVIVSKIGSKRSMAGAVMFYTLYCLSLLTANSALIYAASAMLGALGAVLWTAQNSYLIRASDAAVYGANAGFFATLFAVGAASGVFLMGLLLPILGYRGGFALFAFAPLVALPFLLRIEDIRVEVRSNKWREMKRAMVSPTALRISAIWFVFNFIQGLMLGVVPLEIKKTIGVWAIGILVGSFYIMPMLFSYLFGKISDVRGRRGMVTLMYGLSIAGVALMFGARIPTMLVGAILLLAFNFGISRTITFALVGDISTAQNVEAISSLTWMVQSLAFTAAIVISLLFRDQQIYFASLVAIGLSYLGFFPLRRVPLSVVRERIAQELGTI